MPRKRPAAADLASTEVVAKKSRSSAPPPPPACVQSSKRSEKDKMTCSSKKQMDSNFSTKRCKSWFHEYSAKEDTIGPEGMEKFCEDIGVEPENIVMLVLAYKLGAKQMGFFTLSEWQSGMTALQCDCTEKLRGKLDYLRSLLNDTHLFKAVFRYAYDFAVEKGQRSLDMQTSIAMLSLLLGKQWPLYSHFLQYLEQSKYKVVNKDQWYNVLEFAKQVHPDLSNYDEDGAWPVLLDEFVEWYRKQIQTTSETSENVSNAEARGNGLVNGHHTLNTF